VREAREGERSGPGDGAAELVVRHVLQTLIELFRELGGGVAGTFRLGVGRLARAELRADAKPHPFGAHAM
jgi:hypothetical protein